MSLLQSFSSGYDTGVRRKRSISRKRKSLLRTLEGKRKADMAKRFAKAPMATQPKTLERRLEEAGSSWKKKEIRAKIKAKVAAKNKSKSRKSGK